ncbi:MAG TPA: glycoside hydrolase family 172 protein [Terracidiphilus sp.]|nr:glycoside hydrolase family 172 protein [Terracidiphilus sp.]
MTKKNSPSSTKTSRRKLLGGLATVAGASSLLAAPALDAQMGGMAHGRMAEELFEAARLKSYKSQRSASWDRTGGNGDSVPVEPGATATILDVKGAGVVTHLWFTIASPDPMHLKNLVLRAWWDGESSPSIETPIGDFFGLGLGKYFTYQSELTAVAPVKALNAYFKMPFATAAKMTVTNDGPQKTDALYFAVDYVALDRLPEDLGRFHAQYRQATPCKGTTNDWVHNWDRAANAAKNLDGKNNYVFMEATGRGHFVGVTHGVLQNQEGWFGEGDDMIFVDGDAMPTINGTGTEDYYNGAWDFGGEAFANMHQGSPHMVNPERIGGEYCLFRWHTESPIAFEKSIKVTIEHGHANCRSDNFYTVAYWYQTEPHAAFPALPPAKEREPRVVAVGGGAGPEEEK